MIIGQVEGKRMHTPNHCNIIIVVVTKSVKQIYSCIWKQKREGYTYLE